MIYLGTLMVSVLSFFTTYQGLTIFLDQNLALLGSLGLQMAMLGIAWNLLRMKQHRAVYTLVFASAAVFSIFFSYANFNTRLKENTRAEGVRAEYAADARPVLRQYASLAKEALSQGQYQVQRVVDLREMEESTGWSTVVDEGSEDPFIQSIIDGARRTVSSWQDNQGSSYKQGSGQGIISNYLTSWSEQAERNVAAVETYVSMVDSVSMLLSSDVEVARQYELVNYASVHFPTGEYAEILTETPELAEPPFAANYVEHPANGQQALREVIGDLHPMDRLSLFSLLFAMVIDFIVIAMALCGSYAMTDMDYIFARVEREATRRIKKTRLDDPREFNESLRANLNSLKQASQYGKALDEVMQEFENVRGRVRLTRGGESVESDYRQDPPVVASRVSEEELRG